MPWPEGARTWPIRLLASQCAGSDTYVEQYLYDLQADPYELTNLIGRESHQEVAEVMQERLIRRMVEVGEDAPEIVAAKTQPGRQRRVSSKEARS